MYYNYVSMQCMSLCDLKCTMNVHLYSWGKRILSPGENTVDQYGLGNTETTENSAKSLSETNGFSGRKHCLKVVCV
jgi:hypothetical protein